MRAFNVFVRPLLESVSPVWNPWLIKDITAIERVQRCFTRRVCKKCGIQYNENDYMHRLDVLNIKSLEYRRVKLDLCLAYKILNGLVDLPVEEFFAPESSRYELRKCNSRQLRAIGLPILECRVHFFGNRIVPIWNQLPESIVSSRTFATFRSRLDAHNLSEFCKCF